MYCKQCGFSLEENERFCSNCGCPNESVQPINSVNQSYQNGYCAMLLKSVNKAHTLSVAGSIAARISLFVFLIGAIFVGQQGYSDSGASYDWDAFVSAAFVVLIGAIINIPTYFSLSNKSKLLSELSRNIELNYNKNMVSGYMEKLIKGNKTIMRLNTCTVIGIVTVVLTIVQILACKSIKDMYSYYEQMNANGQL